MAYRLVALDLDGTVLDSNHEIAPRTIEVLRRLCEQNITICIATGRSISSILPYVDQLNLPRPIPIICFNGSIGFSALPFTPPVPIFSQPIVEDMTIELLAFADRHGLVAQYYNGQTGTLSIASHRLLR